MIARLPTALPRRLRSLSWPRLPWLSLRGRLTLWYSLTLAVTLWLLIGFLYAVLQQQLAFEIDRSLEDRAQEANRLVRWEAVFLNRQRPRLTVPHPNVFAASDTFVQIAYLDGEVLGASANLGDREIPLDEAAVAAVRRGESIFEIVEIGDNRFRLLNTPLHVEGRPIGVLQVARSLEAYDFTMALLRVAGLVGGLVSVGIAAIVGSLLARAALRPIERLAQTAEAIGQAQDFSRRVRVEGGRDEIGRLATTFNTMLERLQSAYAGLEAALASQRRFVADASHELRTPLTTIRGNAGLLQQFPNMAPEDREAALAQMVGESERMTRLIHDLLTLARADAGQRLARQPVALRPIVEEVVRQGRLLREDVVVSLAVAEDVTVDGHSDALRQLLLILVDNGTKYTSTGGRVTVSLRRDHDSASIEVVDTGCGIASDDLPHIFDRFYRGDRARSRGGTGLGLAIAQWIVGEHQGAIAVESEVGKGTVFQVRLPAVAEKSYSSLTPP